MRVRNLFRDISAGPGEVIDSLLAGNGNVTVERIVSHGGRAPADGAFEQGWTEFVVLVRGQARLVALEPEETFDLKAGDWLEIPPNRRHYVAWTSREPPAVWLAVHLKPT
ncbi:MAG: cupin domain-containing protein [Alphaproteobacteria bacterium]